VTSCVDRALLWYSRILSHREANADSFVLTSMDVYLFSVVDLTFVALNNYNLFTSSFQGHWLGRFSVV
jgi:hypothetical protein